MAWFGIGESRKRGSDQKRAEEATLLLIKLLHVQRAITYNFRLDDENTASISALGYLYGFVDAGLQSAKLSIPGEFESFMMLSAFESLCPGKGSLYMRRVIRHFSDEDTMRGVMAGGEDYLSWIRSGGKVIPSGWEKLFEHGG
jgi:hypothetical protein